MGPLGTQEQRDVLEPRLDRGLLSSGRRGGGRILLAQVTTSSTSTATSATAAAAFDLERDVPAIMLAKGWRHGAAFQRQWFSGTAKTMDTDKKLKDTNLPVVSDLIKMDWVLSFDRAKAVYDRIIKDKVYATPGARAEIAKTALAAHKKQKAERTGFGDLTRTGRDAYDQHVTFAGMEELHEDGTTDMDDLLASLGRFSFYAVPEGEVALAGKNYDITVKRIGVMVGDYFDFDGYQPLGWWKRPDQVRMPSKWEGIKGVGYGHLTQDDKGFTWVENASYRKFRADTGRGADFIIFSDVKPVAVDPPLRFSVPSGSK